MWMGLGSCLIAMLNKGLDTKQIVLSLDQWLEGLGKNHLRYVWRTCRSSPRVYLYAPGIAGAGTISDIPS